VGRATGRSKVCSCVPAIHAIWVGCTRSAPNYWWRKRFEEYEAFRACKRLGRMSRAFMERRSHALRSLHALLSVQSPGLFQWTMRRRVEAIALCGPLCRSMLVRNASKQRSCSSKVLAIHNSRREIRARSSPQSACAPPLHSSRACLRNLNPCTITVVTSYC